MEAFAFQAQPTAKQYDGEAAEKIKMIVHRTILERRKVIRDNYLGSQRKFLTDQKLDDGIKTALDDYLKQRMLENENECPQITEQELEFLVERCWESVQEYERMQAEEREYEEQLANFISNEEQERDQYYAELEYSMQQERAAAEGAGGYQGEYQGGEYHAGGGYQGGQYHGGEYHQTYQGYQGYQANMQNQANYEDDDFI